MVTRRCSVGHAVRCGEFVVLTAGTTICLMGRGDDLGLFRRLMLMLFGLFLAGHLKDDFGLSWLIGVFGLLVFLAAIGVVEVAMALWYRAQRRQPGH